MSSCEEYTSSCPEGSANLQDEAYVCEQRASDRTRASKSKPGSGLMNPKLELKRDGVDAENERERGCVCARKDGRRLAAGGPKRFRGRE